MQTLITDHLADLLRSGLSNESIAGAGFYTLPPRQIKKILGFDFPGINSAYAIPYHGIDDFTRLRCFPAEGATCNRYYQRKGSPNHLYIPAGTLDDQEATLYITEGEKKALKASQEGIPCIAIGGLWNWRGEDGGLIPDFKKLSLDGRVIHIIPDNDYILPDRHGDEKNLRQAVQGLAEALIDKGALVSIVELPTGPDKGIDDYLITHTVAEFLALPTRQVRTLSIEDAVAEVSLDTLDAVLKRVAKLPSASKQEALVAEISKSLKISKTALKKDLKHHGAKIATDDKAELPMIALFPTLVDLVDDDGKAAFLIRDTCGDLRVESAVDLDDVQYMPPPKENLPRFMLLPRAEQCLTHYRADDHGLFDDLLTYFKRFSFLPAEQWLIAGLFTLATYLQDHRDIHYQAMLLFYARPERGKSRTGKAITYVAYRGVHLVDMRESNIFRYSGNMGATIFFDIQDLKNAIDRAGSRDLMLLRYEKGATVSRVLYPEKGAFQDTVHYSIGGPTIMASNADIEKILGSRCLLFSMPNAPGNYENPTPELGLDLKARLVAWRAKHMGAPLPDIQPIDGILGRLWDITKPLFQLCRVACPERYDTLVAAVQNFAGDRTREKKESFDGILIQVIYEMTKDDTDAWHFDIPTADVTTRFNEIWKGDKPKRPEQIGRTLKALGIQTDTKTGFSMVRLDRSLLNITLSQYGYPVHETTSTTSITSKRFDNTNGLGFEVPFEVNSEPQEHQKTSKAYITVNSDSFEDLEVPEDILGEFAEVAEQSNLRELRI